MKYRVLEINGLFYPQKKCFFGWRNMRPHGLFVLTLEEARDYIERRTKPDVIKTHAAHKGNDRDRLVNFHIEVMKEGLIHEGLNKWHEKYLPLIKERAEKTYNELYLNEKNK